MHLKYLALYFFALRLYFSFSMTDNRIIDVYVQRVQTQMKADKKRFVRFSILFTYFYVFISQFFSHFFVSKVYVLSVRKCKSQTPSYIYRSYSEIRELRDKVCSLFTQLERILPQYPSRSA